MTGSAWKLYRRAQRAAKQSICTTSTSQDTCCPGAGAQHAKGVPDKEGAVRRGGRRVGGDPAKQPRGPAGAFRIRSVRCSNAPLLSLRLFNGSDVACADENTPLCTTMASMYRCIRPLSERRNALIECLPAGKTTLLRLIAGLEEPTDGKVFFGGACLPLLSLQIHLDYTTDGRVVSPLLHEQICTGLSLRANCLQAPHVVRC